ncbi:MAG TPA: ParB/RepB/Spo0J family partition protein [Woeseiaceae bacterium]|nr:ParB/RepB/Spo0J family partition protein [Woeseiaceae bacterium]
MSKQKRLGRGLEALLESRARSGTGPETGTAASVVVETPVDDLRPGRYQPRQHLPEAGLAELADSIREQGVLQPLIVRPLKAPADGSARQPYEIVAGERRWRAAKVAGLTTVPVVVRELDDQSALAVALIENLQREDLNPLDQAQSLSRLADEFDLTHEQVAKAVGRSRASVSNLLRLLELQEDVKKLLATGKIDMGHARALLPLDAKRQVAMARRTEAKALSVRQVEKAVRDLLDKATASGPGKPGIDMQTRWLQQQIAQELKQKFAIRPGKDGEYTLHIGFRDLPQLQDALQRVEQLVGSVRDAAGPRVRESAEKTEAD